MEEGTKSTEILLRILWNVNLDNRFYDTNSSSVLYLSTSEFT